MCKFFATNTETSKKWEKSPDRDVTFCCLMPTKQVSLLSFFLDDPHMIFQYLPFLENIYSYIWSGLWWSTTWLRLLHSLEIWRREKAWEEERSKSKKYSQVEDYELLREVEINVLDVEHRTCSISLQDSGESHWPAWCYEWTRGAIVKRVRQNQYSQQVKTSTLKNRKNCECCPLSLSLFIEGSLIVSLQ